MKMRLLLVSTICLLLCSGCASIITGKYQTVIVTSEPSGAYVKSNSGQAGWTPCSLTFKRNKNATLTAEYEGLVDKRVLRHGLQGWFWGNIIAGGIVGGVIDLSTGACDKLSEDDVHFDFTGILARRQARRVEYVQNHPQIDEKTLYCIETGRVIEGMSREQIVAAIGKPSHITENENGTFLVYTKYGKSTIYPLKQDVYYRPQFSVK